MEPGAKSRGEKGEKKEGATPDTTNTTKAIVEAHHGLFNELHAIQQGALGRLNETYQSYARQVAELGAQVQGQAAQAAAAAAQPEAAARLQGLHEEYLRAVQVATAGAEVSQQMAAAFQKYKAAVIQALQGPIDQEGIALLGQSMQAVAMSGMPLPVPSTP
jgi:hypothetical protein